ncbi:MAG: thioredoxin family protein [Bacteroidales bacterium]|nr:thioredoxin family protein [Bacteroidales bacterium]MCF8457920.1 thioredoxin family protein [Bacteroidales bacterium]
MVRRILPWVVFVLLIGLIIIGFSVKDKMNHYVAKVLQDQASPQVRESGLAFIDSLYNYTKNALEYKITFLEFGAKGCSSCRMMETVMAEIKLRYPDVVNVVFINVHVPENLDLMRSLGIVAIPTQLLLDKNGNEFFRHTGYLSASELEKNF